MDRYRHGDQFEAGERFERLVKGLDKSEREALARFVRETDDDGTDLLVELDDNAARTLMSYPDSRTLSKVINDPNYLPRWRNNLVELEGRTKYGKTIRPDDVNRYLENLEEVEVHKIESHPNKIKAKLIGDMKSENGPLNFFNNANEVERIAYYSKRADSVTLEPDDLNRIDLAVNYDTRTEFIELKNANEELTGRKIEEYIQKSQGKFAKAEDIEFKKGDDKVLEISARDGVDEKLGQDGIEQTIEEHVSDMLNKEGDIQLTEIRVHLSKDTNSITCSVTDTGVEC